jgi:hypothetical protein
MLTVFFYVVTFGLTSLITVLKSASAILLLSDMFADRCDHTLQVAGVCQCLYRYWVVSHPIR